MITPEACKIDTVLKDLQSNPLGYNKPSTI